MEALMLSLLVWIGANSDFKIPENQSAKHIKQLVQKSLDSINTVQVYRSVRIDVDVDPH